VRQYNLVYIVLLTTDTSVLQADTDHRINIMHNLIIALPLILHICSTNVVRINYKHLFEINVFIGTISAVMKLAIVKTIIDTGLQ